jgi:lysophospholipase L1-like esterase
VKTALIIGDSHVDPVFFLGAELGRGLTAQGYTVTVAGVGGTSAISWLSSPVCRPGRCVDVATLPQRPDLLLVSLGTNDAANMALSRGQPEPIVAAMQKVLARFSPKASIWIGPPWLGDRGWYRNEHTAKLYAAAHAAGVPIFDSRDATRAAVEAGDGDGVHLRAAGSKAWAAAVLGAQRSPAWTVVLVAALAAGVYLLAKKAGAV